MANKLKKIALAAGGTGGHMFPAEALAHEMTRRGWHVILFTDKRGMRYTSQFPAKEIITLPTANPNVKGIFAKLVSVIALSHAILVSFFSMLKYRPLITVGFGGYPSAPTMLVTKILGRKLGVHEQNAVLGRVNRFVSRRADFVAHAFAKLDKLPPSCRGEIVAIGNPVRDEISRVRNAPFVPPAEFSKINILIFGGSQGASILSDVLPDALSNLPQDYKVRLKVTQQVRESEIEGVQLKYRDANIEAELKSFFTDMPQKLVDTHLVVSRAGGSSVTEIATVGRPAIFVPLAIAMDDHQKGNADVLGDADAAIVVLEKDFTSQRLTRLIKEMMAAPQKLSQMAQNAALAAPQHAMQKLADIVERTAQ